MVGCGAVGLRTSQVSQRFRMAVVSRMTNVIRRTVIVARTQCRAWARRWRACLSLVRSPSLDRVEVRVVRRLVTEAVRWCALLGAVRTVLVLDSSFRVLLQVLVVLLRVVPVDLTLVPCLVTVLVSLPLREVVLVV